MTEHSATQSGKSQPQWPRWTGRLALTWGLIAAAVIFCLTLLYEHRKMRAAFLEHARLVAGSIDLRHIEGLTASETDLTSPDYRSIKDQLTSIQRAAPRNRLVYLLGQRPDGVVVFLADSEPLSSREYSPPGRVYPAASAGIRQAFSSGGEIALAPHNKGLKGRPSVFSSVSDPETGRIVAVLGMDIETGYWLWELVRETSESLALVLVFVIPLTVYVRQRRRSEKILQHASAEWRRTFDAIPDMITILDNDHRILRANRATWLGLGCEVQDLLGQPCYRLVHGLDAPHESCPHAQLMQDGLAHSAEIFEPRLNAHQEITVTPLFDTDGIMTGSIHIAHDISGLKLTQEELTRKNVEIEQFIYTVSHDLRSPLVTVKTFLGYLEEDISSGDSDRIGADMGFIHTAADRMEALLNELLDMARTGRAASIHEQVTFQELVSETLDALAGQINECQTLIQVSDDNLILCGDRRRLLQIWQNLLDNALKYMGDQAAPRIGIGVEQQGGETVFFVRDNGIGIAAAYHEKVFGIFEQLDRQSGGVGMGLAMVKRIVELYGGNIRVESEGKGMGSCFRFTLPGAVTTGTS